MNESYISLHCYCVCIEKYVSVYVYSVSKQDYVLKDKFCFSHIFDIYVCHKCNECIIYVGVSRAVCHLLLAGSTKCLPLEEPFGATSVCILLCRALPGPCQDVCIYLRDERERDSV